MGEKGGGEKEVRGGERGRKGKAGLPLLFSGQEKISVSWGNANKTGNKCIKERVLPSILLPYGQSSLLLATEMV